MLTPVLDTLLQTSLEIVQSAAKGDLRGVENKSERSHST